MKKYYKDKGHPENGLMFPESQRVSKRKACKGLLRARGEPRIAVIPGKPATLYKQKGVRRGPEY